jgi:hypothetical protein
LTASIFREIIMVAFTTVSEIPRQFCQKCMI